MAAAGTAMQRGSVRMANLAYDISRCASGDKCPLGKRCLRWLDDGAGGYRVPFTAFPPSAECPYFIPVGADMEGGTNG